ncbi:siderophore-interacting protein [Rhodococcus phenolicus]|uniref:siderophore-interacting protein n=1 Tax=Rhodococcus phenolicus TaxID=263849 RepID=UPI00082EC522|nr:siderophore-interacting protein [Rhodococcus phenolicus]
MAEQARTATRRTTKFLKPVTRELVRARVLASERISPSFVRVTVGGERLSSIAPMGFDHWFRMLFPETGQSELHLPTAADDQWWPQLQAMPDDIRPLLRNYTIRRYRPAGAGRFGDTAEIDIDFASHGDLGPASVWADTVRPGEELGLLDEGIIYQPFPDARWQLLVGDESALPALAGILDSMEFGRPVEVFVEVADPDDVTAQELRTGPGVRVHPVVRSDPDLRPDTAVTEAVRAAVLPDEPGYVFLAGESGLVTGVRRHLVRERGLPKSSVSFTGYWNYGAAAY